MRQAARQSALDAQAGTAQGNVPIGYAGSRGLAVAVLTAPSERDGAVRDTERRAGEALETTTAEEGLSLRQAVERCGSGALTVREGSRLRQLNHDRQAAAVYEARHMHHLAIRTVIDTSAFKRRTVALPGGRKAGSRPGFERAGAVAVRPSRRVASSISTASLVIRAIWKI